MWKLTFSCSANYRSIKSVHFKQMIMKHHVFWTLTRCFLFLNWTRTSAQRHRNKKCKTEAQSCIYSGFGFLSSGLSNKNSLHTKIKRPDSKTLQKTLRSPLLLLWAPGCNQTWLRRAHRHFNELRSSFIWILAEENKLEKHFDVRRWAWGRQVSLIDVCGVNIDPQLSLWSHGNDACRYFVLIQVKLKQCCGSSGRLLCFNLCTHSPAAASRYFPPAAEASIPDHYPQT